MKIVAILGGGLIKDGGRWRTTFFSEKGDNFGSLGDRLRVVAASILYEKEPDLIILALGGKGQLKNIPDAPTVAEIIRQELVSLGVGDDHIIKEEKSGNSFEQLENLGIILKRKSIKQVAIITNRFHLPRVKAMLEYLDDLISGFENINWKVLAAETICLKYERQKWQNEINGAYGSENMRLRIRLEKKGVADIKAGKYKT